MDVGVPELLVLLVIISVPTAVGLVAIRHWSSKQKIERQGRTMLKTAQNWGFWLGGIIGLLVAVSDYANDPLGGSGAASAALISGIVTWLIWGAVVFVAVLAAGWTVGLVRGRRTHETASSATRLDPAPEIVDLGEPESDGVRLVAYVIDANAAVAVPDGGFTLAHALLNLAPDPDARVLGTGGREGRYRFFRQNLTGLDVPVALNCEIDGAIVTVEMQGVIDLYATARSVRQAQGQD